ncbi:hydrogen maturation protease-like protein [Halorhabdus tiamatea SARL4B]|uniref:Hydrogen maturation protease-like protein n=1 Tax=Halorhabdus tiamatea SARL4B TaxID=1033806 RepID=S6D8S9_9EURY|nr:hydrogen maturation protease-like protein [Halorhabdus tiamatea SARL4B]
MKAAVNGRRPECHILFAYGEGMTDAVEAAVPALIEEIGDDIERALVATPAA